MKKLIPLLGWLVFLVCVLGFLSKHGTQWEFGRYGMPASLLAPDGWHYLDGTSVDPLTLSIVRAGIEEETYLSFIVGMVVAIGLLARSWAKFIRRQTS